MAESKTQAQSASVIADGAITDGSVSERAISDGSGSVGFISDHNITALFAGLTDFKSVLVAVSGGADSVALMILLHRWRELQPDLPNVEIATIDHGLRASSASEAQWVGELASTLGLTHTTKCWTGDKPTSGLQAAARQARYRLLLEICAERDLQAPVALVTAHTQDDQAETVVMRLARGSGVDGLGAMAEQRPLKRVGKGDRAPVMLVRPLLDVSKQTLVAFLKAKHQTWRDDPSNTSRDFERIRLRQAMPQFETLGVGTSALALSAKRARRARAALDQIVSEFVEHYVAIHNGAYAGLSWTVFQAAPDEIQMRVLTEVLSAFGGAAQKAQLSQIEALQATLTSTKVFRSMTLGGCIISLNEEELQIYREPGREPLPELDLLPGQEMIWDQRFQVSVASADSDTDACQVTRVRPLDATTFAAIRGDLAADYASVSAQVAQTLPSFWRGDQLLALPTLEFMATMPGQAGEATAHPGAASGKGEEKGPGGQTQTGHGPCSDFVLAVFIGIIEHRFGT